MSARRGYLSRPVGPRRRHGQGRGTKGPSRGAGPPDDQKRSRLPFAQILTPAGPPKPLRSSSKKAAGRARPDRGSRVPRKPQAAQVEPGRRHRKSRFSSLPFLRGDLVTGRGEVPLSGGSQSRFSPQHAAPQALQFRGRPALCCRRLWRGEAASIAIREGEGRRVERVPGEEAAEGRRARRRRSESAQPAATPRAATWGAAEGPTGAPGCPALSPRGLGCLLWLSYGPPWHPSPFAVNLSAPQHPAHTRARTFALLCTVSSTSRAPAVGPRVVRQGCGPTRPRHGSRSSDPHPARSFPGPATRPRARK
ncbi:uncharacterized protein LOC124976565 [Sciurus carolinensis]|uniref:uncharacterized protein LOC124976565 n=1 Tax=Sciurus carolinensis TaxID=30640 RepID=UPI001FB49B2A|nr:uncharacterized protein LOC124976565 [Sciurus carolinensis]